MVANTQVMIDYLTTRYADTGAGARADCLAWLQRAEDLVWSHHDWWFKQRSATIAMTTSTMDYVPAAPCNNILRLQRAGQQPLEYITPRVFDETCRSAPVDGEPRLYTLGPLDATVGTPALSVFPRPSENMTFNMVKEIAPATLADSTGSQSAIPTQYRQILLTLAEFFMQKNEGQIEALQLAEMEKNPTLMMMLAEDRRRPKVTR